MKKCFFLLCLCLVLSGCAAKAGTENIHNDNKVQTGDSSGEKMETEEQEDTLTGSPDTAEYGPGAAAYGAAGSIPGDTAGSGAGGVSSTYEEEIQEDKVIEFLEGFEPDIQFITMDEEEAVSFGEPLKESYQFIGRKTEDGFGYVICILKDEKDPLENWTFYGKDDFIAAEILNGKTGNVEQTTEFRDITAAYQGDGNRILYLQPKEYVMPDELQQAFYYRFCSGEAGIRYLQDMTDRGVRFSPPDNGAYLCVERYENGKCYTEYILLTKEEEKKIMESDEVIDPLYYGNYGLQFYVSQESYEKGDIQENRITAPALAIAEERCRFEIIKLSEIHDIVRAELKMKFQEEDQTTGKVVREWEETETLSSSPDLKKLEEILQSSQPSYEGKCPYTAILTLTRKDGTEIILQVAVDSCDGFILGSHSFYSPGMEKTKDFWALFPIIRENTGWAEKR